MFDRLFVCSIICSFVRLFVRSFVRCSTVFNFCRPFLHSLSTQLTLNGINAIFCHSEWFLAQANGFSIVSIRVKRRSYRTKKSTEIVIYKPKSKNANLPPPPVPGILRVSQMVVLGVTVHDRLSFKPHIENLICRCAQTFYALRVLKSQVSVASRSGMSGRPYLLTVCCTLHQSGGALLTRLINNASRPS